MSEKITNKPDNSFLEKIKNHVDEDLRGAKGSAILIPLIENDKGFDLLFELRSFKLMHQPGEVCFPGGRIEDSEDPETAAIREATEELLIDKSQIEIIAPQPVLLGPGSIPIYAFLGLIRNYTGSFSSDEVDHTFSVPIKWFYENPPERYYTELKAVIPEDFPFDRIPGGRNYPWRVRKHSVYFYNRDKIWGLTAKIVYRFIKRYYREISEEFSKNNHIL